MLEMPIEAARAIGDAERDDLKWGKLRSPGFSYEIAADLHCDLGGDAYSCAAGH